jgi:two-component system cell cycle sensor histidine kinase/response regulator CckA
VASAQLRRAIEATQHDRLRVLSESARSFAEATTDPERLLKIIVRSVAHVIKDMCSVFLLSDDKTELIKAAVGASDPNTQRVTEAMLAAYPILLSEQAGARHLIETGEPLLVPQFDPDNGARSPEYAAYMSELGVHSLLLVALRVRGESIGMLTLVRFLDSSPAFDEYDRELAQLLADHAALAIGNSRSWAAERRARAEAEAATAALRESESMHRLLFEESPFPTYVLDAETLQAMHANEAALRLYGYTRDEFSKLHLRDLRDPENEPQLAAAFAAAGEADTTGAGRHRHKDGRVLHVEGKTHLSKFAGRRARLAVIHDVTERVRTLARLQTSESRFARLAESGVISVVTCDVGGHILEANAAFLELFGYGRDELQARALRLPDLSPEDAPLDWKRTLEQLTPHGVVVPREQEYRRKNGERLAVLIGMAKLDATEIIAFMVDLSEQKRSELAIRQLAEQLRQAQKMEAVGRLAGGVAHDFNNVLSIILSYSDMLRDSLQPSDPARGDVDEIIRAATRAADLTRQLLMFSRRQVLEPKVLDLNRLLERMHNMLERLVGEDIALVLLPRPGLGRIHADPSSLEQVVMNLVVNARDAMPRGGKLTIETADVQLDETYAAEHLGVQPGPHVMLAVSDNGIGMDATTIAHIFEPFFTTKEQGKGTGLGLSTAFGVAQQSGGSIWVYSEPGQGTTFKIYLPQVDGPIGPALLTTGPLPRGTETILLVEDQAQVRAVARSILQRHGYLVLEARDADDALQISRQHDRPIDLLLTDVVMPQLSGPALATQILATRRELRVLCMSGYTDDSIVRHGLLEAEMAYLQKPITPETLTRKVREVLDARPCRLLAPKR